MRTAGLDHIGIVVRDLEAGRSRWAALFGVRPGPVEELQDRGVRLVKLSFPEGPAVELLSPLGESSPLARFLEERGEGIHHLCFEVKDLEAMMRELRKAGLRFVSDQPQKGAGGSLIAFVHPRSLSGVLLELKEAGSGPAE
jgi:methylmalonyl-CoA/ethylmalonyl-CoA epimerase